MGESPTSLPTFSRAEVSGRVRDLRNLISGLAYRCIRRSRSRSFRVISKQTGVPGTQDRNSRSNISIISQMNLPAITLFSARTAAALVGVIERQLTSPGDEDIAKSG